MFISGGVATDWVLSQQKGLWEESIHLEIARKFCGDPTSFLLAAVFLK